MLKRPDIPHACASCGTAVTAGENECRHCNAYAALGVLNDVTQRLLPNPRERGGVGVRNENGGISAKPRVLDPCCGGRMMYFDKQHPDVVFGDLRRETITVTDRSHGDANGTRVLRIEPDTRVDFRALPYPDGSFKLVAFDPPHLVRAGPRSWLAAKYGKLGQGWRDDLRAGFAECFRVLEADGVLIFKWNETQVKVREVLALTPLQPLFGHTSGRKGLTHWLVFLNVLDRR